MHVFPSVSSVKTLSLFIWHKYCSSSAVKVRNLSVLLGQCQFLHITFIVNWVCESDRGTQPLSAAVTGLLESNKSFKFEILPVAGCHLARLEIGCSTREKPGTEQGDSIKAESSHMAANQHFLSLLRLPDANQSPRDLRTVWLVQIYSASQPLTFIKDDLSRWRKKGKLSRQMLKCKVSGMKGENCRIIPQPVQRGCERAKECGTKTSKVHRRRAKNAEKL